MLRQMLKALYCQDRRYKHTHVHANTSLAYICTHIYSLKMHFHKHTRLNMTLIMCPEVVQFLRVKEKWSAKWKEC